MSSDGAMTKKSAFFLSKVAYPLVCGLFISEDEYLSVYFNKGTLSTGSGSGTGTQDEQDVACPGKELWAQVWSEGSKGPPPPVAPKPGLWLQLGGYVTLPWSVRCLKMEPKLGKKHPWQDGWNGRM